MTQPPVSRWRRRLRALPPSVASTAVLALLCNAALELTRLSTAEPYVWQYKTPAFVPLFLLGTLLLWPLIGVVRGGGGRGGLPPPGAAGARAVPAVADHEKTRLLHEPLYPSDLEYADDVGFLTQMLGARSVLLLAAVVILTAAVTFAVSRVVGRRAGGADGRQHPPRRPHRRVAMRTFTCGLCLLTVTYLSSFNAPGNAARNAYEALGAKWRFAGQHGNYLGNGFVGGFLYNLEVPMPAPPGYSEARMARLAARYEAVAERLNGRRERDGLDDVNVVLILSESFSDPLELGGVHLEEDPIPFIRRLMSRTTSGRMLAQAIGSRTANMEFETLTGLSMSQFPPQLNVAYQALVPDYETFPSVVGWLKQSGHRAVAVHPFTTELYRRSEVYPTFGFDDFVYDERMHAQDRIGNEAYISDASAFDEAMRLLEDEDAPLLLNLVTMQNHMPFTGRYDDPLEASGPDGEPAEDIGQYARGLSHTDEAVRGLVRRLRRSDEKTVVVFYGDHLPGDIYGGDVFAVNDWRTMHQTPFFVWANFRGRDSGTQPTTSPIHFMDLVLERADATVPPYYALLHRLRHAVPAMEGSLLVDAEDQRVAPDLLSPRAARLLRHYELVHYDLSVGARYSEAAMFAPVP